MKHATGIVLILANLAAFLHDELSGHWPTQHREWVILFLAAVVAVSSSAGIHLAKALNPNAHEQTPSPPSRPPA